MAQRFGLVCEGISDFAVLEHLLNDRFGTVEFSRLQPHGDATGRPSEGGWRQVLQWCLRNGAKERRALFESEPIFATSHRAQIDLLLVHLDADVCEHLKASDLENIRHLAAMPISNADERATYIKACLAVWLGFANEDDDRCVLVVPVEATEAWLIAGEYPEVEACRDLMGAACKIIYEALGLSPPVDGRSIKKKPEIYRRYIKERKPKAADAFAFCRAFADVARQIEERIA